MDLPGGGKGVDGEAAGMAGGGVVTGEAGEGLVTVCMDVEAGDAA
jgi:hypothetical protein